MYKLTKNKIIVRLSDDAQIPEAPGNRDYIAYLSWLAEGNTPAAADPPSADELKQAQYLADATAAKQNAKMRALVAMTPAQVQAWVTANVTNLAQAQDAIATLAVAVSILARRL